MQKNQSIKEQLNTLCEGIINERLHSIEERLSSIKEARNNETKSSVGDKYETGRAMMQQEEDKIKVQQYQTFELKQTLEKLKESKAGESIGFGSLVKTNARYYYLSVALGKIELDDIPYFCVSMASPIGKKLKDKQLGDSIELNGNELKIEEII